MSSEHLFLFSPGIWLGEGKISFTSSPEFIKFFTKWQIVEDGPHYKATQVVEMVGITEQTINSYVISEMTPTTFQIELSNAVIGAVQGVGVIDDTTIAWEFHHPPEGFEGFEVYEKQETGDYFLHAEFSSGKYRTIIEGLIWKKENMS